MSRTGAIRHIHRYLRTYPNLRRKEPIWTCTLEGCTHFIPYNTTVLGRANICWGCGIPFLFSNTNLTQEMPKCQACTMAEVPDEVEVIEEWVCNHCGEINSGSVCTGCEKPKE